MKKHSDNLGEGIFSKNIVEFTAVANQFCKLVENTNELARQEFIEMSQKILALLYLKSLLLDNEFETTNAPVEKFVSENDWATTKDSVSRVLAGDDTFLELYELDNSEPLEISLSECFADIYQDLKDFISLYEIGFEEAVNEALFELKGNFERIWGQRILLIMKELHEVIFAEKDIDFD